MELKEMGLLLIKNLALFSYEVEKICKQGLMCFYIGGCVLLTLFLCLFPSQGFFLTVCCSSRYQKSDVRYWSGEKYKEQL